MYLRELTSILLLAILLTSCIIPEKNRDSSQSDYAQKYPSRSFFLYQSVLRIANVNQDPEINKLIKDLDRVDVHILNGENPKNDMKALSKELRTDGFEDLFSARTQDIGQVNLKSKTLNGKDQFVVVGDMNGKNVLVEFQGKLNLKYINALSKANWSKLTDQLAGNNYGIIDDDWEEEERRRQSRSESRSNEEASESGNTTEESK